MPTRSPIPTRTVIAPKKPKPTRSTQQQSPPKPKTPESANPPSTSLIAQSQALFPALVAEAERLSRQGHYSAAISLYTRAIETRPTDPTALSLRSKCRILQGEYEIALQDAEQALKADPSFAKALAAKAEALFAAGNFEDALVWYHRGAYLRADVEEFRVGVLRCKQAIMVAIQGIDASQLKKERETSTKSSKGVGVYHPGVVGPARRSTTTRQVENVTQRPTTPYDTETFERNLLEELYEDRVFLRGLASDPVFMSAANGDVGALVREGERYMEGRLEYWKIRNPSGRPASAVISGARRNKFRKGSGRVR
ncbi:uncharacterized protein SPPG_07677 [Spizellomyces punctatus DAOM BR117]|uniref:Outer dynein arm-docking complex subunit 4 n=1 Tax=Spizellomyces punctatus (strain DAOM BR117) TaxID=645134 RepID=A0A0L0H5Q6_SPIPD|nr:uncharacterized protein SPPG_07677 [Spizellomyces punctatus DAOM BR117]KNC96845.1 hypothetical protein SPPG_07677 [Spizellomyces punctatus DAOM BR117]|eukprot:XP_016604885.1 hypothetical protein SPPG_07677 [Spizellomyces punctatus DAOM BR117]